MMTHHGIWRDQKWRHALAVSLSFYYPRIKKTVGHPLPSLSASSCIQTTATHVALVSGRPSKLAPCRCCHSIFTLSTLENQALTWLFLIYVCDLQVKAVAQMVIMMIHHGIWRAQKWRHALAVSLSFYCRIGLRRPWGIHFPRSLQAAAFKQQQLMLRLSVAGLPSLHLVTVVTLSSLCQLLKIKLSLGCSW